MYTCKEPIIQTLSMRHRTAYCAGQKNSNSLFLYVLAFATAFVFSSSRPELHRCSKLGAIRRNIDSDTTNENNHVASQFHRLFRLEHCDFGVQGRTQDASGSYCTAKLQVGKPVHRYMYIIMMPMLLHKILS